MDYDIEREKQKSAEIRKVFREMFPLADELDLPWAECHIKGFLRDRIKREVEEGTAHFVRRVTRVLCEISPPKTHIEDMARIVVNEAMEARSLREKLKTAEKLTLEARNQLALIREEISELKRSMPPPEPVAMPSPESE